MNSSESLDKLAQALVKAHGEMPVIPMDGTNPYFKSKYATLGSVISKTRPILAKHGLAVMQMVVSDNEGIAVGVKTILMHESGQWIEDSAKVRLGFEKNAPQEAGAIISYIRRYALSALLNIYSDEDIDGSSKEQRDDKKQEPEDEPDVEELIENYWKPLAGLADELGIEFEPLPPDVTPAHFEQLYLELQSKVERAK